MHKASDWKRSTLEVEAVLQSCIPQVQIGLSIVLCKRSLLFVESFYFRTILYVRTLFQYRPKLRDEAASL
jgi:hypothetical protein